ncbi:hypothetical protein CEP53_004937 [Fusarium sp. AF-6]|nr:hypothetical protein CEP53_004937 [Fusarium sp. AF-6]
MSSLEDDDDSSYSFRFLLPNVGETEEVERYETGGFHPVHLGDLFDKGWYRVVHKLGAGGFATIWLARDLLELSWVALKIVLAEESQSVEASATLAHSIVSESLHDPRFVTHERYFHIEGPNGRHLCLVLPVLGPSAYRVSHYLESRIQPRLARNVALQAAEALADLHSRGLCHGDLTPANIMFRIKDFDHISEDEIYDLLGKPETGPLETESGEPAGPEAPRYIVKTLDFLKARRPIIKRQSIEGWIKKIFDQPGTGPYRPKDQVSNTEEHPFYNPHEVSHAPFYAWKFWELSAINFRGKYFRGYNHEWHALVDELPKISNEEAGLLFDLISKILVYEPTERYI